MASYRVIPLPMNSTPNLQKHLLVYLTPDSINFDFDFVLFFDFRPVHQLTLFAF